MPLNKDPLNAKSGPVAHRKDCRDADKAEQAERAGARLRPGGGGRKSPGVNRAVVTISEQGLETKAADEAVLGASGFDPIYRRTTSVGPLTEEDAAFLAGLTVRARATSDARVAVIAPVDKANTDPQYSLNEAEQAALLAQALGASGVAQAKR